MRGVRRHPVLLATAISALASAVYLVWQPQPLDLAAQVFRAELWEREGWVVWNEAWYGGHEVPGYSLLFPPLGALLGPELLGAICAIAAAAIFATIATRAHGERAWFGAAWFGLASTVPLYGGRTTFALGLTLGLGAMLALQGRRALAAPILAAAAALASPVAGLFTALAGAAVWSARRDPASIAVVAAASIATLALALAFPTDGFQPFVAGALLPLVLACLAALAALPGDELVLRRGAALYLLLALAAFLVETPLGGNVVRLGTVLAGPVLAVALWRRRTLALALLAVPLLWWQWTATVRDVAAAEGEESTEAAYYEPLVAELERRAGGEPVRIEIPPTRSRWEAAYVAPSVPLARGWLRQLESDDFDLFDDGELDADSYGEWLYLNGVSYVALPDAEPDALAEDEVDLLERGGLPYLREVWTDEHWRLFEVRAFDGSPGPRGASLASGGAVVTELGPDGFTVEVPRPGEYLLYIRHSPYFEVVAGEACVEDAGDGDIRLTAEGEGPQAIEVRASFSIEGALGRNRICA